MLPSSPASMDLLDMTIVNVAVPKLMAVFGVDVNRVQWVATAYMMTIGVIIPVTAYLADTFGTKKFFIASMVFFTTGTSGFLLLLFVLWELFHRLELRLFADPTFCLSILLSAFAIMAIMGSLFLLPVFLQDLRGYGPMKTGLLLLPEAIAAAVIMPVSGPLVNKRRGIQKIKRISPALSLKEGFSSLKLKILDKELFPQNADRKLDTFCK